MDFKPTTIALASALLIATAQGHAIAQALADLGATVTLVTGPVALPFQSVARAKLVLTDELIKAAQKKK